MEEIIGKIIEEEGGYVNHPHDKGGATKYGITQKTLDDWQSLSEDVKDITLETAKDYYRWLFNDLSINKLPPNIQHAYFDMCVNHGERNAALILQRSINTKEVKLVEVDGKLGPITIRHSRYTDNETIKDKRVNFYADIVANNHSQVVFLKGWLARARRFV